MSFNQFKENECLLTTQKHCPCIEFILAQPESGVPQRHGFHASQLLHYRLEANEGGQGAPPEKLTLAFATADVTLTGWRLDRIADDLRGGDLLAVRTLLTRYAQLDVAKPQVATITVEPVSKS
jgi:hypothetical protein